jgi:hypothetical protein
MKRDRLHLILAVLMAAVLWFYMFSPWTQGRPNFWLVMSCAAVILTGLAVLFSTDLERLRPVEKPLWQLLGGIVIAFALWGIFWIGDRVSAALFDFARPEVQAVYAMKTGLPSWAIALLLLFLIGPAEEFFWRGYVQHTLERLCGGRQPRDRALLVTAAVYALVHIWSLNFMLVMAALVAGLVWGLIYRFCPKALPALIVSHALWDVLVFILLPIVA